MLEQYKEAIEKSNIISKTDVSGIITFVNEEFCKISGYTKDELIGANHNIVRHPDIPNSSFKKLWDIISSQNTYKNTVKNLAKDGSTFYVNTTITPILDNNGKIFEYIAIRYDVTDQMLLKFELEKKDLELKQLNKDLERKVQEKTKELKELNRTLELRIKTEISKNEEKQKVVFHQARLASLGQMLANIAHQWRQPLTQLSLTLFNMKKESKKNNQIEVKELYSSSKMIIKNMSDTIEDFTEFFKPDKSKTKFIIKNSVNEAISLLSKIIKSENICIKTNMDDIDILGVQNELSQIFINFLQNSKDGFIINNITKREIDITIKEENNFAIIEFKDNAGGIDCKVIDNIFEPYFTTKHQSSGTGLGLFMSNMICEQSFNGSMSVISKDNNTIFRIQLPINRI